MQKPLFNMNGGWWVIFNLSIKHIKSIIHPLQKKYFHIVRMDEPLFKCNEIISKMIKKKKHTDNRPLNKRDSKKLLQMWTLFTVWYILLYCKMCWLTNCLNHKCSKWNLHFNTKNHTQPHKHKDNSISITTHNQKYIQRKSLLFFVVAPVTMVCWFMILWWW